MEKVNTLLEVGSAGWVVRMLVIVAGTSFATRGLIDQATLETIAAGCGAGAGIVWSWYSHRRNKGVK